MPRHIVIIQGHPDPDENHFGRALSDNYRKGAGDAGHEVRTIDVAQLDFPLLRNKDDWQHGDPVKDIKQSQEDIFRANHLVLFYPLWLGTMPALLKGFLEQVLRPGFAITESKGSIMWKKRLTGKSARVVVTMGMPAFFYRWYFHAHSLKSLERNILKFCGISPIRESLIGLVEMEKNTHRKKWLKKMYTLGQKGK